MIAFAIFLSGHDPRLSAITTEFVEALMDGLMAGLTLAIMLFIAPDMAGIVVAAAVLYAILRWISHDPLRQVSMEAIVWRSRLDTHFLETLRGIRTIKLFTSRWCLPSTRRGGPPASILPRH